MKFDIEWCAEKRENLNRVRDALDALKINTPVEWSYVRRAHSALTRIFSHINTIEFIHGQKDSLGYNTWLDECHCINNIILREFELMHFYMRTTPMGDKSVHEFHI